MGGQQENSALPTPMDPWEQHEESANPIWGSQDTDIEHEDFSQADQQEAGEVLKKKKSLSSSLMTAAILVIAGINYFLKTKEDLAPPPPPPSPSVQSEREQSPEEEIPNADAVAPGSLRDIQLSFSQSFSLIKGNLPYSSDPYSTRTQDNPPQSVQRTPRYQGDEQRYGEFHWGTRDSSTYPFVFDLHPNASKKNVLYIDLNQNGDLSDDGPPLSHQGAGIFGALLKLPSQQLFHRYQGLSQFEIWIFINEAQYRRGYVGHYSRTQAKAVTQINGQSYTVQIVDRGNNDADFRNDGIYIDVNLDGSIEPKNEYVPPGEAILIGGRPTRFQITE